VLTAVIGVLVLAGAAFLATRLFGGDDTPEPPSVVATATPTDEAEPSGTAASAPAPTKETVLVGVYNGTGATGLAAQFRDLLKTDGYPEANLGTGDTPPDQRAQTSVVMFKRGARAAAVDVADTLGMTAIQQLDGPTQALVAKAPKKWDVVVIVGADKSQ
jgi:hypothetical protein